MLRILPALLVFVLAAPAQETQGRWESAIAAFEKQDAEMMPPKNGIVFVGSSSIRLWDTAKWFPDLGIINRGFGGSQLADSVAYADRIVIKYAPRIVVLYAGDNDIASGKSSTQVYEDYRAFVTKIHDALPDTRIIFIGIKPSIARWKLVGEMRAANHLIEEYANRHEYLDYLNVDAPMIGEENQPIKELFASDGLHLNETGYELWTRLLRPLLEKTPAE